MSMAWFQSVEKKTLRNCSEYWTELRVECMYTVGVTDLRVQSVHTHCD